MAGAGWKAWTRERLSRTDLQGYIQDQVVARFASASARASQLTAPGFNQVSVRDDVPGSIEWWTGGAWASTEAALAGRSHFSTGSVANGAIIHGPLTIPSVPYPSRIVLMAAGRGGFAAAARGMRWYIDSVPAEAINVLSEEALGGQNINLGATEWGTITVGMSYDLPALVAGTYRLVMASDGNAYNRGGVNWYRTRL